VGVLKNARKIEDKPVLHTIWRNGKFFDPIAAAAEEEAKAREQAEAAREEKVNAGMKAQEEKEPARKKAKTEPAAPSTAPAAEAPAEKQKRPKIWLDKGLYAGQEAPCNPIDSLSTQEKKGLSQLREFSEPVVPNKALPFPIFGGMRLVLNGRDFKMPFDVHHPLMEQPKPKEWRKITKSEFLLLNTLRHAAPC
jgi:histone-lysine N-methyltransferase ASH1L